MRNFHIPFDMRTEDKIIGGYFSLRQLGWCAAGVMIVVMLFGMDKSYMSGGEYNVISIAIRAILSLIALCGAGFLAFGTLDELSADAYLFKKISYETRAKVIKYTDKK